MIYFIRDPLANQIKIGYIKESVRRRLNDLQDGNPSKLTILKVIEGDKKDEHSLHRIFKKDRGLGEWFQASKDLLSFIESDIPTEIFIKSRYVRSTRQLAQKERKVRHTQKRLMEYDGLGKNPNKVVSIISRDMILDPDNKIMSTYVRRNHTCIRTIAHLCKHLQQSTTQGGFFYLKASNLVPILGTGRSKIASALRRLTKDGFLEVVKKGGSYSTRGSSYRYLHLAG